VCLVAPFCLISHSHPQPRDGCRELNPALADKHRSPWLEDGTVVRTFVLPGPHRLLVLRDEDLHLLVAVLHVPVADITQAEGRMEGWESRWRTQRR
jgi:hypothetical protein